MEIDGKLIDQTREKPLQVPEEKRVWRWRGMVSLSLSGVLVALILVASWSPDSRMAALRWVPSWAAEWADRDPNIRTAVPFIPLAFLLTWGFAWRGWKWPVLGSLLVCGACLGLAELGQAFLPTRTADVADLMWGGAGILIGVGLAGLFRLLLPHTRTIDKVGSGHAADGANDRAA